jgi:hypothetical protein
MHFWSYIFVHQINLTAEQDRAARAQMPKWVGTEEFEIEERAGRDTTKDEIRFMMRSLLADRFKLQNLAWPTHKHCLTSNRLTDWLISYY